MKPKCGFLSASDPHQESTSMLSGRNTLLAFCAIIAMAACPAAQAMTSCSGKVSATYLGPDGDFNAQFGYGWTRICNVGGSLTVYRGAGNTSPVTVTPAMCSALMSFFMTAQAAHQTITAIVDRNDCNMGSEAYANPYPAGFTSMP